MFPPISSLLSLFRDDSRWSQCCTAWPWIEAAFGYCCCRRWPLSLDEVELLQRIRRASRIRSRRDLCLQGSEDYPVYKERTIYTLLPLFSKFRRTHLDLQMAIQIEQINECFVSYLDVK